MVYGVHSRMSAREEVHALELRELQLGLEQELESLDIISCHEHNLVLDQGDQVTLDHIFRNSYVGWCGVEPGSSSSEREEFIRQVGTNSYYRWLLRSMQKLYEFEGELNASNWEAISTRLAESHVRPDWYFTIMRKYGRIEKAILDAYWDPGSDNGHPEFYFPTFRINALVMSHNRDVQDHNGNNAWELFSRYGMAPGSFSEYLEAVEALLTIKKQAGCVALKCALAYDRSLAFTAGERGDAQAVFGSTADVHSAKARAFQDYMFRFVVDRAGVLGLPVQCHVGLGKLHGSSPMNLLSVIEKYPRTRFVLFHGGYPWIHEIGGLLHNYDNVYADLVWLPLISPTAAIRGLHEWIEVARTSEKITWGGDCWTPEETYGAVLALRYVVAKVLSEKILDGYFGHQEALELARQIFGENARKLYGL